MFVFEVPEHFLCFKITFMLQNIKPIEPPTNTSTPSAGVSTMAAIQEQKLQNKTSLKPLKLPWNTHQIIMKLPWNTIQTPSKFPEAPLKSLLSFVPRFFTCVSNSRNWKFTKKQTKKETDTCENTFQYGSLWWSRMVLYGPIWSRMVFYGPLWSLMVPYGPIWSK